jgi:3-oxoacyl-[acyl-carrier protein] reductase
MIPIDLTGRNALVTGGAAGLGRAISETLGLAGAAVAVVDIDLAGAQRTAEQIVGSGGRAVALRCDVASPEAVTSLRRQVAEQLGAVDILINNAGIIRYSRGIANITLADWDRLLTVNLRGAFLMSQAFLEGMKARGWGRIVCLSSLAARVGGIEVGCDYTASKAGLIGLGRTLAKEGAPFGVTVNLVAPGIMATGPVQAQMAGREDQVAAGIPLGRLGQPQDVANGVLFLCSSLADYITGIVVDINGGMYMG